MIDGHRWTCSRTQSEPGVDVRDSTQTEALKRRRHEEALAAEGKTEQDTDLQTPPRTRGRLSGSPPPRTSPQKTGMKVDPIEEGKMSREESRQLVPSPDLCITPSAKLVPSPDHFITTTTKSTPLLKATESPSGSTASPNIVPVRGHSGADHPPSADEIGLGASFGQDPTPHQLQLGERGHGDLLSSSPRQHPQGIVTRDRLYGADPRVSAQRAPFRW